jgi:hypothetical protein
MIGSPVKCGSHFPFHRSITSIPLYHQDYRRLLCRRRSSEHIQSSGSSEMTAGLKGSVRKLQFNFQHWPQNEESGPIRKPSENQWKDYQRSANNA